MISAATFQEELIRRRRDRHHSVVDDRPDSGFSDPVRPVYFATEVVREEA